MWWGASTVTSLDAAPRPSDALSFPLLAAPVLMASALLPAVPRTILALGAIIVLGVPHGALDGELARTVLRPRFGRSWFLVFALPYLVLSAVVLLAWRVLPVAMLAAFLAVSLWHFGSEETGSSRIIDVVAVGGLPIALAVLAHPAATATLFGAVSRTVMVQPPSWLWEAASGWIGFALVHATRMLRAGRARSLAVPALLVILFVILPPLTAFAIYFVCVHAPAHMLELIRDRDRAPRIRDQVSAFRLALPVTLLTLLLGAALWPLYPGPLDRRLLCLTIQGLAALTLPHMLFEFWLGRHERGARRSFVPTQSRGIPRPCVVR